MTVILGEDTEQKRLNEIANRQSFHTIFDEVIKWTVATFGTVAERGPVGPLKHLLKEIDETKQAFFDVSEYGDLLILLCDIIHRCRFTPDEILEATKEQAKFSMDESGQLLPQLTSMSVEVYKILEQIEQTQLVSSRATKDSLGRLLVLLVDCASTAGFLPHILWSVGHLKMRLNLTRVYNRVPDGEVSEHDRTLDR